MIFTLSEKSQRLLMGVHTDLVRVVNKAIGLSTVDFMVIEGLRSLDQQKKNVADGASRTLNSRHLTGHAVDLGALVNGHLTWDYDPYISISIAMKNAAKILGIPIEWGGDWKEFKDGTHFQLPWSEYPVQHTTQNVTFLNVPSERDGS